MSETIVSGGGGFTSGDGDEAYCAACGSSYPFERDLCPRDGTKLTKLRAQPDAMIGRVFDERYEVRTSLGQGGMGTVYRGWQLSADREVAIKVIHPKLASDRTAVKRFLRECRIASRLSMPGCVNVYDFGQTDDGVLFLVMELLKGHTLGRELAAMQPLPMRRVTTIGLQLCDALDVAHSQNVIHRDLKPNNIVILDDPPGRDLVKVLDFGLAKSLVIDASSVVTQTDAIVGTPLYMAPEQIEGKPTDQRADLYALGCILHQMVTGRPPFVADTVNLVLSAHLNNAPPPLPPSTPTQLAQTIEQLMSKEPGRRPPTAAAARAGIQAAIESGFAQLESDTSPDAAKLDPPSGQIELAETLAQTPSSSGDESTQAAVVVRARRPSGERASSGSGRPAAVPASSRPDPTAATAVPEHATTAASPEAIASSGTDVRAASGETARAAASPLVEAEPAHIRVPRWALVGLVLVALAAIGATLWVVLFDRGRGATSSSQPATVIDAALVDVPTVVAIDAPDQHVVLDAPATPTTTPDAGLVDAGADAAPLLVDAGRKRATDAGTVLRPDASAPAALDAAIPVDAAVARPPLDAPPTPELHFLLDGGR